MSTDLTRLFGIEKSKSIKRIHLHWTPNTYFNSVTIKLFHLIWPLLTVLNCFAVFWYDIGRPGRPVLTDPAGGPQPAPTRGTDRSAAVLQTLQTVNPPTHHPLTWLVPVCFMRSHSRTPNLQWRWLKSTLNTVLYNIPSHVFPEFCLLAGLRRTAVELGPQTTQKQGYWYSFTKKSF